MYPCLLYTSDGSLSNVKVLRSVSPSLDAEAIRVVGNMPKWEPGMQKGQEMCIRDSPMLWYCHDRNTADSTTRIKFCFPVGSHIVLHFRFLDVYKRQVYGFHKGKYWMHS